MADETQPQPTGGYKRPVWQWVLIYLIIAAVVYGVFYYFVLHKHSNPASTTTQFASPTVTTAPTTQPSTSSASPSTTSTMKAVQVTVTGTEFAFNPSVITVSKGQTVEVTFKNAGTYPHNFTISDLGVKTATIQPGQTATVTFTADKAGSFEYICTVPGHADRGMKGTLTVK